MGYAFLACKGIQGRYVAKCYGMCILIGRGGLFHQSSATRILARLEVKSSWALFYTKRHVGEGSQNDRDNPLYNPLLEV